MHDCLNRLEDTWLTAYSYYYNHLRSHQALDNQPPLTAAGLSYQCRFLESRSGYWTTSVRDSAVWFS